MKKTLLAVIPMTCISMAAHAVSRFNRPHVGIQGGVVNTFANIDAQTNASFATTVRTTVVTTTSSVTTTIINRSGNNQSLTTQPDSNSNHNFAAGAINIGIGSNIGESRFYLGGELGLSLAKRHNSSSDSKTQTNQSSVSPNVNTTIDTNNTATLNSTTKAKLKDFELDADLKAGYIINPNALIYARLGGALNRIKISSENTLTINDAYGIPTSSVNTLNISDSKYVVGFRLGIGGEYFLTENMTGSLDYIYTWYGSKSVSGNSNIINTFATINTSFSNGSSANIHTQSIMVGINYYFDNLV